MTPKQIKRLMYHDVIWLRFAHSNDGNLRIVFSINAKLFNFLRRLGFNFSRQSSGKFKWHKSETE